MKSAAEHAKAIRAALAYTGHTQEELARKMGISTDTLTRRMKTPGRFTLDELSAADKAVRWTHFLQEEKG